MLRAAVTANHHNSIIASPVPVHFLFVAAMSLPAALGSSLSRESYLDVQRAKNPTQFWNLVWGYQDACQGDLDFTGVVYNSKEFCRKKSALCRMNKLLRTFWGKDDCQDTLVEYMFRNRCLPVKVCSVECRPSAKHAKSVFATRDIAQGEIVTLYPADYVFCYEDGFAKVNVCGAQLFDPSVVNPAGAFAYEINCEDGLSIAGEPKVPANPTYMGHLVKDVAVCPPKQNVVGVKVYESLCIAGTNLDYLYDNETKVCFMVALKPIRTGEEVLLAYGPGYWDAYHRNKFTEESVRESFLT